MSIYFDTVMNSMILKSMEMSHYINYAISIQWYSDIRKKWGSIKQNKVQENHTLIASAKRKGGEGTGMKVRLSSVERWIQILKIESRQ
jgi:hypothetical protein